MKTKKPTWLALPEKPVTTVLRSTVGKGVSTARILRRLAKRRAKGKGK